jgi:ribosomal protein S13
MLIYSKNLILRKKKNVKFRLSRYKNFKFQLIKQFGVGSSLQRRSCKQFGFNSNNRDLILNSRFDRLLLHFIKGIFFSKKFPKTYCNEEDDIGFFLIDDDLKKFQHKSFEYMKSKRNKRYRIYRTLHNYPCRGQRTHTNAKTKKRKCGPRIVKKKFGSSKIVLESKDVLTQEKSPSDNISSKASPSSKGLTIGSDVSSTAINTNTSKSSVKDISLKKKQSKKQKFFLNLP